MVTYTESVTSREVFKYVMYHCNKRPCPIHGKPAFIVSGVWRWLQGCGEFTYAWAPSSAGMSAFDFQYLDPRRAPVLTRP